MTKSAKIRRKYFKYKKVVMFEMMGHTHMAVGIATGLLLVPPGSLPELLVGVGAGAVGGLICDIDVGTSKSHKQADIISMGAVLIVAAVLAVDWIFKVGIHERLMQDENFMQIFFPAMCFIGICAYGKGTPHRTFMHSFLVFVLLTACVGFAVPMAAPYFGIGFLSHIFIDMFNKRRIQIFYPSKKGVCFKLCSSHGKVNKILFYAGTFLSGICILLSIYNIYDLGKYFGIIKGALG